MALLIIRVNTFLWAHEICADFMKPEGDWRILLKEEVT
jgi:hypothetical protein